MQRNSEKKKIQKPKTLSSFDQFSNFVLLDAVERRILSVPERVVSEGGDSTAVTLYYHDIPLGLYVVRGDSVVLLGQVEGGGEHTDQGQGRPGGFAMKEVSLQELEELEERKKRAGGPQAEVLNWDFDTDLIA